MSKILQVISKNTDFENGKVKLELYETSFTMLSKIIGDVDGQTVANISVGDAIGYQLFRDLNVQQYALRNSLESFKTAYNTWIDSIVSKVTTLSNFDYTFTETTSNYADTIEEDDKMDMLLMNKIAGAEKELYDYTSKAEESMENNLSSLKSWSNTQKYGSCVYSCISREFEMKHYGDWKIYSSSLNGINVEKYGSKNHDKQRIKFYNVNLLTINKTATATMKGTYFDPSKDFNYSAHATWSITRVPLYEGDTEGYIRFNNPSWSGAAKDEIRGTAYVDAYTGISSPHFDTTNLNLPFLKSRILI